MQKFSSDHPSTSEIIRRFAANDRQTLETIYKENYPAVVHYVVKNNGEETDAKDIFQDAVLAAWLNVKEGKFDINNGSASLGGYIYQIAKFKWLDKLKSKKHRSTIRLVVDERNDDTDAEVDELDIQEKRLKGLSEMYQNLGDKCKAILTRFYYDKKSLAEIGKDLNYDAATLRTLKYRCMNKLRQMYQDKMDVKSTNEQNKQ